MQIKNKSTGTLNLACQQYTVFKHSINKLSYQTKDKPKFIHSTYCKREQGQTLSILQCNHVCSPTLQRRNCNYFAFKEEHFFSVVIEVKMLSTTLKIFVTKENNAKNQLHRGILHKYPITVYVTVLISDLSSKRHQVFQKYVLKHSYI